MAQDPVVVEFRGFCSKKNRKAPNKNGRGLHIEPETRKMIERMELQVPSYARDLMLDNPEAEWSITYTNASIDMDGIMTTVLDILQKYKVIVNDNLAHFGNRQVINQAVRGEYDSVTIVLIPRASDAPEATPRYIDPRRQRLRERIAPPTVVEPRFPVSEPEPVLSGLWEDL